MKKGINDVFEIKREESALNNSQRAAVNGGSSMVAMVNDPPYMVECFIRK